MFKYVEVWRVLASRWMTHTGRWYSHHQIWPCQKARLHSCKWHRVHFIIRMKSWHKQWSPLASRMYITHKCVKWVKQLLKRMSPSEETCIIRPTIQRMQNVQLPKYNLQEMIYCQHGSSSRRIWNLNRTMEMQISITGCIIASSSSKSQPGLCEVGLVIRFQRI